MADAVGHILCVSEGLQRTRRYIFRAQDPIGPNGEEGLRLSQSGHNENTEVSAKGHGLLKGFKTQSDYSLPVIFVTIEVSKTYTNKTKLNA